MGRKDRKDFLHLLWKLTANVSEMRTRIVPRSQRNIVPMWRIVIARAFTYTFGEIQIPMNQIFSAGRLVSNNSRAIRASRLDWH